MLPSQNDLFAFLASVSNEMAQEYERIRRRVAEDPGTAGDQGEENWAALLREWLPPGFKVVTKGRIMNEAGRTSPQVDVIVLDPNYPEFLLGKKLFLSGGVVAAFECKLTLHAEHIKEAFQKSKFRSDIVRIRTGTPYEELYSPIAYGILAHSHDWKKPGSNPIDNIDKAVRFCHTTLVQHPREEVDVICVSDLCTWFVSKSLQNHPIAVDHFKDFFLQAGVGTKGVSCSYYCRRAFEVPLEAQSDPSIPKQIFSETGAIPFTPIGSMLAYLWERLARENASSRPIAEYFRNIGIHAGAKGIGRYWASSVFSPVIRPQVEAGRRSAGDHWDFWCV
jgi:hypothetical protein